MPKISSELKGFDVRLGESWTSPKTKRGLPSKIKGLGFFAAEPIAKGEKVFVKMGRLIDRQTLLERAGEIFGSELQIDDDWYIAPVGEDEAELSMVYINHSCEPNVGFDGEITGVTLRDIAAGEELTLDYATFHDDANWHLECQCGSATCRRLISGKDWLKPELQQKYAGHFAWFIERKIKALYQERQLVK